MDYSITKGTELGFVFGGNAIFTLQSKQTGRRYTYKVTKAKDKDYFFAKLLFGKNNETDYRYIGLLTEEGLHKTAGSCQTDSYPITALNYFIQHATTNTIPETLGVYHAGRCCHCGRLLTTPESIQKGIGPECEKVVHLK